MNTLRKMRNENGILVAAHRGVFGANIPCNTIAAFDIAVRSGAKIIEMDLFKTTDGKIYIFHTGTEPYQINKKIDLTTMDSSEISSLRLVNIDFNPTKHGLDSFDDVLEHFKNRDCLLNLDRCGAFLKDVVACVKKHNMKEQILLKTAPTDDMLMAVQEYAPTFMYMPIYIENDTATEKIEQMNIHFVGAELVFETEQSPVIQDEYISYMKHKNLILWGNGVLYSELVPLAAGHSDDVSMIDSPDLGWGWLAKKGFDIIQTDWAPQCYSYLQQEGYSN
ncbi:MAG: glycerophosphodiester phosphodiesterase family protein [Christensenellaceae bacterium]|nr:glycerophosphodiester phosphodiesterase family protein [Christensenellaceae bacterium]